MAKVMAAAGAAASAEATPETATIRLAVITTLLMGPKCRM
jgi:hypothetical protein